MKPLALRKILVATDLTPEMLPALRSARRLAELSGASLHVVHCIADGAAAEDLDARIAAHISDAADAIEVRVLTGPAGPLITQEAARTTADVIVLGRHRNRADQPGSTADRVVRTAQASCLILPVELALPLSAVVVPVDVTEAARGELEVALTWASALRRRTATGDASTCIFALHVRGEDAGDESEPLRERLREEIVAIRNRFAHAAGVDIEPQLETSSDIARTIIANAESRSADLIVIGTRGNRIADDPLGSVSASVVKYARTPILLVPPEVWRTAGNDPLP